MNDITVYTLDLTSDYFSLLSKDFPLQTYKKILFTDSIFSFYPYAEISIKDPMGIIGGSLPFIECMSFSIKFGFEKRKIQDREVGGYIEHDFISSELQIKPEAASEIISGIPLIMFISKHFEKDFKECNIYKDVTVSEIVKNIISSKYSKIKNKYITETNGKINVSQYNIKTKDFIKNLCSYAYSQSQPTECFYTFINLKNEIYFTTLFDLFNKQQPIKKFYFKISPEMTLDDTIIQNYFILYGGLPQHYNHYANNTIYLNSSGQLVKETKQIQEYIKQYGNKSKLTITKQSLPEKQSQNNYIGIIQDKENEKYISQAKRNYMLRDALITYRMSINVHFDPELVTGKIVELEIKKKTDKDILPSQEYSGKWLIIESKHYINDKNMAYTQLLLTKPTLEIDPNNPQYKNLI